MRYDAECSKYCIIIVLAKRLDLNYSNYKKRNNYMT